MTTQLSAKLAAFALALTLNTMMIAGIAYLFGPQMNQRMVATSSADASATTAGAADPRV